MFQTGSPLRQTLRTTEKVIRQSLVAVHVNAKIHTRAVHLSKHWEWWKVREWILEKEMWIVFKVDKFCFVLLSYIGYKYISIPKTTPERTSTNTIEQGWKHRHYRKQTYRDTLRESAREWGQYNPRWCTILCSDLLHTHWCAGVRGRHRLKQ